MSSLPEPSESSGPLPRVTPRDWAEPWKQEFLEALARMPNVSAACRVARVGHTTVYDHARLDPVFKEAWREALNIGVDLMEQIAHQRATTGWESTETRRRVKRVLNEANELVVVEDETVTVTRDEVSDGLMTTLLKAYRPERFRDQVEHRVRPGDELDAVQPVGPDDDGIHRVPTRERTLELARLALDLEPGVLPVIEGTTHRNGDAPPEE